MLAAKALQRPGDYAYIAPFANQMRGIIWEGTDGSGTKFIDYIPRELITRKLDQTMKIWLQNGSTIQLFGSDNPDALVGRNFVGLVFTEYSLHKDAIWGYMRPMLTENGGWALFNGTPRGMNHFYTMAQMAKTNPDWFYEHLTAQDTGFPSEKDIQQEREAGMAESLIEQEFYTSWTASTEETLIPLEFLRKATKVNLRLEDYMFAPKIIGVDPAYAAKGDRAVIQKRQGRLVHEPQGFRGIDPMALAEKVASHIKRWKADYVFVDAGRGEAVWSRLFQLGYEDRVIPVDFNGVPSSPRFANKKMEMWDRAKTFITDPLYPPQIPDHEFLIRDLSAPTFDRNEKNKLALETKKALKKRGFASTDFGDAFVLTFAEELDEAVDPLITSAMQDVGVDRQVLIQMMALQEQFAKHQQQPYAPLSYMEKQEEYHGWV
jgi:hypothetical protein